MAPADPYHDRPLLTAATEEAHPPCSIATAIQWIIPIAGIAAVLFAVYLARDVLSRDKGTQAMQDVAGTIFEGAVAFIRRQYRTIGLLALGGAAIIGVVIALVEGKEVADTDIFGAELGVRTGVAFLVGAACSMASRLHRHVHHRQGRTCAPRPRRASSLVEAVTVAMRGGAVSGFLVVALSLLGVWGIFALYGGFDTPGPGALPDRRLRLRRLASSPSSPSSAAVSTPRPPTSAPTSSARSRPASPRTTRATPPSSPTSSATTSATAPAVAPTSSSPPPPRTSAP